MNKLSELSFKQLKQELINSHNSPVKELIIRRLMQKRYQEYKIKKQQKQQRLHKKSNPRESKVESKAEKRIFLEDDDFNTPTPAPKEQEFEDFDKFKSEIDKDYLNNNLMDRLNSEIDIRASKQKKKQQPNNSKKEFVPPFTDDNSDKYAPFNSQTFSNSLVGFDNKKFKTK